MFKERVVADCRKGEIGIIVGELGRYWLCVVDPLSWKKRGSGKNKLDILVSFSKHLPGGTWFEATVDIEWDDDKKEIIVARKHCNPAPFEGDVVYVYVN